MSRLRSTPGARLKIVNSEIEFTKGQVRMAKQLLAAARRKLKRLVVERESLSTKPHEDSAK